MTVLRGILYLYCFFPALTLSNIPCFLIVCGIRVYLHTAGVEFLMNIVWRGPTTTRDASTSIIHIISCSSSRIFHYAIRHFLVFHFWFWHIDIYCSKFIFCIYFIVSSVLVVFVVKPHDGYDVDPNQLEQFLRVGAPSPCEDSKWANGWSPVSVNSLQP